MKRTALFHFFKVFLFAVSGLVLFSNIALALTTIPGGTITTDTAWGPGTYYITGNLAVNDGYTLTILPGSVIKFAYGRRLTIYGTLSAEGTTLDSIIFTSKDDDTYGETIAGSNGSPGPGNWGGIFLDGSGDNNGIGQFDYCRIRYGGIYNGIGQYNLWFNYSDSGYFRNSISEFSYRGGVQISYTSPEITNCTFSSNNTYGVNISNGSPEIANSLICNNGSSGLFASGSGMTIVTGNTFTDNADYAVYVSQTTISPYNFDNTASGNEINGFALGGRVSADQTWSFGSDCFPFIIVSTVTVDDNVTLTIPAGAVIKFAGGKRLTVYGTLNVTGTSDNWVTLTSFKNDEYGCDTNADGELSTPSPGDWGGIYLDGSGDNDGIGQFDFCRIRYGGLYNNIRANNVWFNYSDSGYFRNSISEFSTGEGVQISNTSPEITNCKVNNNNIYGVNVSNSSSEIVNSIICNNGSGGLRAGGSGMTIATGNTFTDNGGYAVYISQTTISPYNFDNTAAGNEINGFALGGRVSADQTWSFGSECFPIIILYSVTVDDNVTLTIPAGAVIKSAKGRLTVYGTLNVLGTSDDWVTFTSLKDDEYGCDTNADDDLSTPSPGDWGGIFLEGYGDNKGIGQFDFCRIRYGGFYNTTSTYNVLFHYSDSGYFRNSISEFSNRGGVQIYATSPEITNCTVSNNNTYGVDMYSRCSPLIINSIIWGNGSNAVYSGTPIIMYSNIEGGYAGDSNISVDPLFLDGPSGNYHLQLCSPAVDAGDPVEVLTNDYSPGDVVLHVNQVTNIQPGNIVWITDGTNTEFDEVISVTTDSITIAVGFSNSYLTSANSYLYTRSSNYSQEPNPNGKRINMGAYGGTPEAAISERPLLLNSTFDSCISELSSSVISLDVTDPAGGNLSFEWEALDGGSIAGNGNVVEFTPPGAGPHPCPYRIKAVITSSVTQCSVEKIFNIRVRISGDINGDGVVNIIDKVMVRNAFGQSGTPGWIEADVNRDGVVNIIDKVIVRNQFGQSGCSCP